MISVLESMDVTIAQDPQLKDLMCSRTLNTRVVGILSSERTSVPLQCEAVTGRASEKLQSSSQVWE